MAHQHLGLAEIQGLRRTGRAVRHAGGVRELSDRPRQRCRPRLDGSAACQGQRARCDALSSGAGRDAGRAAAAAARLSARPVRSRRAWRRWRVVWCGCWRRRLRTPDAALGSLDILAAAERARILRGLERDRAARCRRGSLPELFAAQAARTPDAVAVVFEDRELSYAALDAHANRLAHHLRAQGVGPETVVGLLRGALAGDGDRAARHPQGRRRLPAARPVVPGGAAGVHAGGRRLRRCW